MARSAISYTQLGYAAEEDILAGMAAANADGISFYFTPGLILAVYNDDVSSVTVTVQTPKTLGGIAIPERVVTVGAGELVLISDFRPDIYGSNILVDFSDVTALSAELFKAG